jgi:hypothetical protein
MEVDASRAVREAPERKTGGTGGARMEKSGGERRVVSGERRRPVSVGDGKPESW